MGFADVYRQTDSFRRMRHHLGRNNVLHARVEGLFFNLDLRVDSRYCTVQAESTLFGLCDVTVEFLREIGVDVLLDE